LSINPRDPDWGESIEVTVGVLNDGTAASGPYSVLFRYGSGDFDVCEWDKTSLPPRNGGTLHCTVDAVYVSFTTEATVDWRGAVDESNEDNNGMELAMAVGASPPDLHITEIRFTPDPPVQGSSNHVGVKVHNQGGTEARDFKVIWRSGEPGSVLEWTVTSLAPGASTWAEWPYTYIGHGHFNTTAEVDSHGDVDEADEDNNEAPWELDVVPS
jgi:subtilase family serine protease